MGAVLPEEEKAMRFQKMQQEVMSELGDLDLSDPNNFIEMTKLTAKKATQYGLPEIAQQAAMQGLQVRSSLPSEKKTVANVSKLDSGDIFVTYKDGTTEIKKTGDDAKKLGKNDFSKIKPSDYTPESVASFQETGDYSVLRAIDKAKPTQGQDLKLRKDSANDLKTLRLATNTMESGTSKIDYLLSKENESAFENLFGGYTEKFAGQYVPGKTQDLKAKFNSLKSEMKKMGLDLIRSGGSVGQMTQQEWPIVQDMIDSITPEMSEKNARDVLTEVKTRMQRINEISKQAYDDTWSGTEYYKGENITEKNVVNEKPVEKTQSTSPIKILTPDEYIAKKKALGL